MLNKFKGFPDKKDMTYWIIILAVITVMVATWRTDSPGILSDQLSLGGTLLSIVLAVIAIIFSFIQSSDSSRQSLDMVEKFSNVTNTINSLNDISQNLVEQNKSQIDKIIQVENITREFNEKITGLKADSDADLKSKDNISEVKQIQEEYLEQVKNIYGDEFLGGITVFGNQSLYNTIKDMYGNSWVHIQVLWTDLRQRGIKLSLVELEVRLQKMANENKLAITNKGVHIVFKLLDIENPVVTPNKTNDIINP
ncbi:hypothetical protein ACFRAM_01375 [Paenibacillus sp. NPDC056722]|uniref:hypothetical protein n=1 Tax=Paenibacillus sp. NPDC056722 TaxID=3345924 RepID=UPI0036C0727C